MKVYLSFLGTGNYIPCVYQRPGDANDLDVVKFVQTATRKKFAPNADRTLIFCTAEATRTHWTALCKEFHENGLPDPERVDVPNGSDMGQIWKIFQIVSDAVPEQAEIVFDPTHSFRSLPIIMTVLLNYLAVAKGTRLAGCYYGAFETLGRAGDVETQFPDAQNRKAPIFDLTAFFRLNDWAQGIQAFERYGDAGRLKELASRELAPLLSNRETCPPDVDNLRRLVDNVAEFAENVRSSRLVEIQNYDFPEKIRARLTAPIQMPSLKPLEPVLRRLEPVFADYASKEILNGLRAAQWAYDHDLIPQGYTLLQETLVSHYTALLKDDLASLKKSDTGELFSDDEKRTYVSGVLAWNDKKKWNQEDPILAASIRDRIGKEVVGKYNSLTKKRNDINHAGTSKKEEPAKPEKLRRILKEALGYFLEHQAELVLGSPSAPPVPQ